MLACLFLLSSDLLKLVYLVNCEKYAQAIYHFLDAGPEYGAKVDFRSRRLYGIGHSLGGNTMSLLQTMEPRIHFASISIVDPMLSPGGSHHLNKLRSILIKGAYERRDVWPDRAMAMQTLKRRDRTKKWDPRILEIFIVSEPFYCFKS